MLAELADTTATVRREAAALERVVHPPAPRRRLTADELEELLLAVADRLETVPADRRARLLRGAQALELELADTLTA